MSITAKIHHGIVTLPPELNLPDGTVVEIVIPAQRDVTRNQPLNLPVFNGGGLQPGVNLDDSRALRQTLEASGKLSQLPRLRCCCKMRPTCPTFGMRTS